MQVDTISLSLSPLICKYIVQRDRLHPFVTVSGFRLIWASSVALMIYDRSRRCKYMHLEPEKTLSQPKLLPTVILYMHSNVVLVTLELTHVF